MCARAALLALACLLVLPAHAAIDRELNALTAASPVVQSNKPVNNHPDGVCQSLDIRNQPKFLERLRGCRVIEGILQIVLMEYTNASDFEKYSFPELHEITGHLLIFRVNNLHSLGKLFPNLSVIRGRTLFRDYSLIIYQLQDLQTIGLYSLTNITRGSVRIEKNIKLCYANTIHWDLIAPARGHVIELNRAENECGLCPDHVPALPGTSANNNTKTCPVDVRISTKKSLCWDQTHCQKLCKNECGEHACSDSGECCDFNCIGGCTGPTSYQCRVCRHLSYTQDNRTHCVTNCPTGLFMHHDHRCISETECRELRRPKEFNNPNVKETTRFKAINGTCIFECPPGFDEVEDKDGNATCERCNGTCTRPCKPGKIDAIETIERFRGCTIITGTLEISIKGGARVVKELESALGQITDIYGSLRVMRSYPLMSLQFLKSLRTIHGYTEDGKFEDRVNSLYIFENPNLEELWDWNTHGNINILNGKLFIHFNPKLCIQKLEKLKDMVPSKNYTKLEVAPDSNGDKAACVIEDLTLMVSQRNTTSVVLKWNAFCMEDDRGLLGYLVYYIETSKPISKFEGRDACGDRWEMLDEPAGYDSSNMTSPSSSDFNCNNNTFKFHFMTGLKPFTSYAIYVKTYTVLSERKGAQSPIIYVKTLPGQPSQPIITKLESLKPNEIFLQWQSPHHPHGDITSYHVMVEYQEDRLEAMPPRNYCAQPPGTDYDKTPTAMFTEAMRKKKEQQKAMQEVSTCKCDSKPFIDNQDDLLDSIEFENQLQNKVYIRGGGDRSRRSIEVKLEDEPVMPRNIKNKTTRGDMYVVYWQDVWDAKELRVDHLLHFAHYTISVWVCRKVDPDEINQTLIQNCSEPAVEHIRTKKLEGADEVQMVKAEVLTNRSSTDVRIMWNPPQHPNGVIVSYTVQHIRVDIENFTPITQCVTRQNVQKDGNLLVLHGIVAGNYSVQVYATSYMGAGPLSKPTYFHVKEVDRSSVTLEVVLGTVGALLVCVLLVASVLYCMRTQLSSAGASKLFASVNPEYTTSVYEPDEWELPRDHVLLIHELGQGSFGMVFEGLAKDVNGRSEMPCAVKTVNEHATERERIDFLNEASVMKAFNTPHVVRLLGVVSCGQPTLVVMELMECGDLKTYLRSHRPESENRSVKANPPTLQRIKQMAIEIADGMAYLSAKKFVHRDLAARNCMVAGDLTVKVGDFGMTRDIYETDYYRKGTKGLLPVRWMSPESLKDGVFTSSSDVWSFGVVLWEMATLAMQPYQGLSNDQVLRYVVEGGVMERPDNCPDSLYELMRSCWTHRASARPSFLQMVATLAPEAAPHFQTLSFFNTPQGQEVYAQQLLNGQEEESRSAETGVECAAGSGGVGGVAGSASYGVSGRLASWARELASVRSSLARSDPDHAELLSALVTKPPQPVLPPNGVLTRRDKDATSQC